LVVPASATRNASEDLAEVPLSPGLEVFLMPLR
jgi:hypothetical protein